MAYEKNTPNAARQPIRAVARPMPSDAPVLEPSLLRLLFLIEFEGLRELGDEQTVQICSLETRMPLEMPKAREGSCVGIIVVVGPAGVPGFVVSAEGGTGVGAGEDVVVRDRPIREGGKGPKVLK